MFSDFRYALRMFRKSPGFTAVVVLSLALGIGANATVLCWLRNLVWRPLPGVAQQSELVVLASSQGGGGVSMPDLADLTARKDLFAGALASQISAASLKIDGAQKWIQGQVVSANFFELLGVKPVRGRTFFPDEDRKPGGDAVIVISERLWRGTFDADKKILGRVVEINRHSFTVVGVVPASFNGTMTPTAYDFWAPLSMVLEVRNQALSTTDRGARGWHNLARLQHGVSLAQAQAAVAAIDANLNASFPKSNRDVHHRLLPLSQCPWGAQTIMSPVLWLLLAVSAAVLLIVAANVANLLLARASSRRKEVAIRLAAGADRMRVARQLFTENLLLAVLGGLAGVLVASWGIDAMPLFLPRVMPANLALDYELDPVTLALTFLLVLGTGVAFGIFPAWQSTRQNLFATLKEGGRSSAGGATNHALRSGLVVAEVALALVLLVSAGLCIRGLRNARQTDIGLNPDRVLLAQMQIGMNGYDKETGKVFYRDLRQRLAENPGVEETALASWFPLGLGGCKGFTINVDGYERPPGEDATYEYAIISPRYFATLRIPFVGGRDFADTDDASSARVAIVNEAFAQRFWPGQDALGHQFRIGSGSPRTIVGVVRTGKYNRLDEPAHPFLFLPYQQGVPDLDLGICVRTKGDPAAFAPALQRAVHALDPGVDLPRTMAMTDYILVSFTQDMAATLLVFLGAVAVVLAIMGVYAVMAYAVSQRTQEFGVRMALGAQPRDVLRHILAQGMTLALIGIVIGLGLSAFVTRALAGFLFGVSPFDPATFAGVSLLLTLIAALACWFPARRATRVDPMIALRNE